MFQMLSPNLKSGRLCVRLKFHVQNVCGQIVPRLILVVPQCGKGETQTLRPQSAQHETFRPRSHRVFGCRTNFENDNVGLSRKVRVDNYADSFHNIASSACAPLNPAVGAASGRQSEPSQALESIATSAIRINTAPSASYAPSRYFVTSSIHRFMEQIQLAGLNFNCTKTSN
jgi:hypothetical protein